MARKALGARRQRGHIRRRGNSFQVLVYAGTDPLTGKPHYLTESTTSEAEARRILPRLLNEALDVLRPLHADLCLVYGREHPDSQEIADLLTRIRIAGG